MFIVNQCVLQIGWESLHRLLLHCLIMWELQNFNFVAFGVKWWCLKLCEECFNVGIEDLFLLETSMEYGSLVFWCSTFGKERNKRTFEGLELIIEWLKYQFVVSLLYWMSLYCALIVWLYWLILPLIRRAFHENTASILLAAFE